MLAYIVQVDLDQILTSTILKKTFELCSIFWGGGLFCDRVRGAMVTSGDFSRASLSFYDAGAAGHLLYFCKLLTLLTKYTLNIHIHIVGYLHRSV